MSERTKPIPPTRAAEENARIAELKKLREESLARRAELTQQRIRRAEAVRRANAAVESLRRANEASDAEDAVESQSTPPRK